MKAIVISTSDNYSELVEMASTLNIDVIKSFVQKRERLHPRFYLGEGKVDEVAAFIDDNKDVGLVLINGIIKPSQHYNIERKIKIECTDRIGLILKIFKMRAASVESKLQIEHAILRYEVPLLKEWIHKSKTGEHPGFLAGGEYRIDIYYDFVKKRINKINEMLKKIRTDSKVKRKLRRKLGYSTVALVGYTNAGKSSLFNVLTESDVFIDDKIFTTLSTTSRKISKHARTIILIDTIGFIEDMPHWIIESFQPTLEEIKEADCLLWIFDGTKAEEYMERDYLSCKNALNLSDWPRLITVLNKTDLLDRCDIDKKREKIKSLTGNNPVEVSAITHFGIDDLVSNILKNLMPPLRVVVRLKSDKGAQSAISWMFGRVEIVNIEYCNDVVLTIICSNEDLQIIKSRFKDLIIRIDNIM